jgi:divalent metal cation (Fe/Co/Zn/Cd) transporter
MKTYRALIGTVVRSKSASVKFDNLLYTTANEHEQAMLDADKRVSVYNSHKKADKVAKQVKKEVEVRADEVKTDTPKPKKKAKKK